METIITAATILAMYFNASSNKVDNGYYYNADIENNKVNSVVVLENKNDVLSQKLKYDYTYDADNKLESKEAMKWNSSKQNWERYYVLDFTYNADGYTVSRRNWNADTDSFAPVREITEYKTVTGEVTAINSYKVNDEGEQVLTDNVLVMSPNDYNILAQY
jgi:hypothetical protein